MEGEYIDDDDEEEGEEEEDSRCCFLRGSGFILGGQRWDWGGEREGRGLLCGIVWCSGSSSLIWSWITVPFLRARPLLRTVTVKRRWRIYGRRKSRGRARV